MFAVLTQLAWKLEGKKDYFRRRRIKTANSFQVLLTCFLFTHSFATFDMAATSRPRSLSGAYFNSYDLEGYGVVSRGNAIFVQHCTDISSIDALAVNDWVWINFRSGAGITTLKVTRVS